MKHGPVNALRSTQAMVGTAGLITAFMVGRQKLQLITPFAEIASTERY